MLLLERAFSSVLLNVQDVLRAVYMQYNLCIMDTLKLFISVLIIRVYLIIKVNLQVYAKAHFGTMTKCVDYAGVLILKCTD